MSSKSTHVKKVSFIGLGVMGYPMAGHLARGGLEVTAFNRTASKAETWVAEFGGRSVETPQAAAENADIVFACVGNDDDIKEVTIGPDGALGAMKAGAIFVDHTTASADVARQLFNEAKGREIDFLDAPISGGQAGAENGVLTVMVGGEEGPFERAEPVIGNFARSIKLMGPSGAGQLTKMVNQICIAGLVQALSEGLDFAERAGLDGRDVIDVISKGAAQSWQMENRHATMIDREFEHGFAVDWMRKDLGFCFEEAERNGADLPITQQVDQLYAKVQALGGGRWDTSSLISLLQRAD